MRSKRFSNSPETQKVQQSPKNGQSRAFDRHRAERHAAVQYTAASPAKTRSKGHETKPQARSAQQSSHIDATAYREVLCTGVAVREATGALEGTKPDRVVRRIDNGDGKADDPWTGNAPTEASNAKVTATTMRVGFEERATTDVDGERERFREYCVEAGETIAGRPLF